MEARRGCCAEEDRKERRRKLGLPEELTDEEKAAERARLAESAKAKPSIGLPVKPVSLLAQLRDALVRSSLPRAQHPITDLKVSDDAVLPVAFPGYGCQRMYWAVPSRCWLAELHWRMLPDSWGLPPTAALRPASHWEACSTCVARGFSSSAGLALQVDMKKTNPGQEEKLKSCWATMLKYIGNIAKVGLAFLATMSQCSPLALTVSLTSQHQS